MSYNLRIATQNDSPGVVAVIEAVYQEYGFTWEAEGYHADLYDLDTHYIKKGWPFWVAEDQETGAIIGTVALEFFPAPIPGEPGQMVLLNGYEKLSGADCAVNRLYVHPGYRRGGTGIALMNVAIQEAKANGCHFLELWSDKRFEKAHQLYQKLGAQIVSERICHDPDQSPEFGLLLPL